MMPLIYSIRDIYFKTIFKEKGRHKMKIFKVIHSLTVVICFEGIISKVASNSDLITRYTCITELVN